MMQTPRDPLKARAGSATSRSKALYIFIDESGSFEGRRDGLAGGIVVRDRRRPQRLLLDVLAQGVAAYEHTVAGGLPDDEVHGHKLRQRSRAGYEAMMETIISHLESFDGDVGLFGVFDRAGAYYQDPNITYAAVLARGLAEYLVEASIDTPIELEIAGRAAKDGKWSRLDRSLALMLKARLAEELAVVGVTRAPRINVKVTHIQSDRHRDPFFAGLLLSDLFCNFMRSGKKHHPKLHSRAQALWEKGCPRRLVHKDQKLLDSVGPTAFVAWFFGPAGPVEATSQQKELLERALGRLVTPTQIEGVLSALEAATDRQLRWVRDLDAAQKLADALDQLVKRFDGPRAPAGLPRFAYAALGSCLDIANHRGQAKSSKALYARDEKLRARYGLDCLVPSFEFRNRAAETLINGFDFDKAAAALDTLRSEAIATARAAGVSENFPTLGRIISHRAQVHHYLGENAEALRLYGMAEKCYREQLDFVILAHHRTRSLIGERKLARAARELSDLGISSKMPKTEDIQVFDADLVCLFLRAAADANKLASYGELAAGWVRPALVDFIDSPYPGIATARNLARVAQQLDNRKLAITALAKGGLLWREQSTPALRAVGLALGVEGVQIAMDFGEPEIAQALFELSVDSARALSKSALSSVREHFGPVADVFKRWQGAEQASRDRKTLNAVAGRTPFGSYAGISSF
jgi:tetratricopeptide (TPR) repeat protein